ncbi:MAG: DUF4411 family protein [Solirubrobacteraceae bacterium]
MRWTIDGSAINRIAAESNNYNAVFAALTELVEDDELTFCDELVEELQRTAENEPGALWAASVKGQRNHKGAGMTTLSWVMRNVEGIVDEQGRNDAMPYVLAQARALNNDGHIVTVITEDVHEKPTRRALSDACDELGIPWIQVPRLCAACGVAWP